MKKLRIFYLLFFMFLGALGLYGQKDYPIELVTIYPDRPQRDTTLLEYYDWPVQLKKITTKIEGHPDFKGAETIFTYNADHNLKHIVDRAIGIDLPVQEFFFEYHDRFVNKITRQEGTGNESVDVLYSAPTATYSFTVPNENTWNYSYKNGDLVTVRSGGREVLTYHYKNDDGQMDDNAKNIRFDGPLKNLKQWPMAGYHMVSSLLRSSRMGQMALRRQLIDFISYDNTFIYLHYKMDEFGNVAQIDFQYPEDDGPFQTTYIRYKTLK